EYRYRLRARNGEIILHGEGYTSKQSCLTGIDSVKRNSPHDERYERKTAVNGQYYFVLKASNGEPVGVSETYTTTSARENGVATVKRTAPTAPIEDLT
ncbi:MAG: YegP family protein, partial [Cyclobacteriaceae bacterium]